MAQHSASPRGHGGSLCLYTWSSCGHFLEPLQCYALSERHGLTKRVQAPHGVALLLYNTLWMEIMLHTMLLGTCNTQYYDAIMLCEPLCLSRDCQPGAAAWGCLQY